MLTVAQQKEDQRNAREELLRSAEWLLADPAKSSPTWREAAKMYVEACCAYLRAEEASEA